MLPRRVLPAALCSLTAYDLRPTIFAQMLFGAIPSPELTLLGRLLRSLLVKKVVQHFTLPEKKTENEDYFD